MAADQFIGNRFLAGVVGLESSCGKNLPEPHGINNAQRDDFVNMSGEPSTGFIVRERPGRAEVSLLTKRIGYALALCGGLAEGKSLAQAGTFEKKSQSGPRCGNRERLCCSSSFVKPSRLRAVPRSESGVPIQYTEDPRLAPQAEAPFAQMAALLREV